MKSDNSLLNNLGNEFTHVSRPYFRTLLTSQGTVPRTLGTVPYYLPYLKKAGFKTKITGRPKGTGSGTSGYSTRRGSICVEPNEHSIAEV